MDLFERAKSQPERPADKSTEEAFEGVVERVVFAAPDGQFCVARLQVDDRAESVTVVGSLLGVPVGARLRVRGHFETNERFGPQLRISHYTEVDPATVEGIRRYLGSGLIKGIGTEFASRIVTRFGIRTLEILDAEPWRIGEVPGIGRVRAESVRKAWSDQREIRRVMVFLQGYGVSPAFAARIYKRYGAAAIAQVRDNPFRLAFDVWGIGFLSADNLAQALGMVHDAPARVQAGIRHTLETASTRGHVFLPRPDLTAEAARLLDVDEPLVQAAIDDLARDGSLAIEATSDGEAVFSTDLYRAERALGAEIVRVRSAKVRSIEVDVPRALAWYEQESGLTLARQQAEAISRALTETMLVVTGGPGVGKTTIIRGIVGILSKKGLRVALGAPTGRAARRLAEATGQPALTLHRLLQWRPREGRFGHNADTPLEADVLIVDEASMLDVRLGADLLAAVPSGARLILVGDVDQLPSVGPGAVLADIISSGRVATVRLTEIFRQAAQSLIVSNAHRIQEGEAPDLGTAPPEGAPDSRDFFVMEESDPVRAALLIRDLVVTRLPKRYGLSPHEIQVLSPMHRGDLGAERLNQLLQEALTTGAPELRRGGRCFRVGDRVMQIRNNYDKDVFNGDMGRITSVNTEAGELQAQFDDRNIAFEADDLDELQLAYAATVHKSQGSEYPAVVLPIHTQHFVMLQRNLLYTAITRGKRLVVIVGTKKAIALAVGKADVAKRCTRLAHRL